MSSIILNECYDLVLYPKPPFNFDGTVHKPSYFPSQDNFYEAGVYWQTMRFADLVLGTKLANAGTVDEPCVKLSVYAAETLSPENLTEIANEIERRYDMQANLLDFYQRFSNDEILGPVLKRWKGMRVSVNVSLYEFLVITTVLQNATVKRSVQMLEKLFNEFGTYVLYDDKHLATFWSSRTIHQTSEDKLRELKVGYRAKTFKRQAELFASGALDEERLCTMERGELKKALLDIYGIGPASVWYLLFQIFKQYDAFEYVSPWEQKIFSRILFGQELVEAQRILDEVDKRWGKWKMLASHYLFEDLFWKRKTEHISWLEELIRL